MITGPRVVLPMQGRVLGLHRLHVDVDLDLVAHEHPTGLEGGIPGEPPLAAVDLRVGAEAHALAAPGILPASLVGDVEGDFLRDVPDREVADDLELGARSGARALDLLRAEG